MSVGYQLAGKRVELLKDIKPDLSRLAVLGNPGNLTTQPNVQDIERVAGALGVTVRTFEARSVDDLPRAFAAMVAWRADGVNTLNDALLFSQRERVVRLTLDNKLAGVHPEAEFPEAGGLLSYGPSLSDLFRRAASYVDKVSKAYRLNSNRAAEQVRARRQSQGGANARTDDQPRIPASRRRDVLTEGSLRLDPPGLEVGVADRIGWARRHPSLGAP